jgi:hypothetical protein
MKLRCNRALPDALASAWVREVRCRSPYHLFTAKRMRLFERAARPIEAELAAALAPSERLANGTIRLRVPIGRTFKDDTIRPGQKTWMVDFDPKTGRWDAPGAASWQPGIASLAAHVWHVMGRSDGDPLQARWDLLANLGFALLYALERERST